jgi:hypothetical protein
MHDHCPLHWAVAASGHEIDRGDRPLTITDLTKALNPLQTLPNSADTFVPPQPSYLGYQKFVKKKSTILYSPGLYSGAPLHCEGLL